jgi:hypothetical protein
MLNRIKSFNQFNKLNEAGWNSIDENYGEITVNGVTLSTAAVCYYDTPYDISYEICVNPSEEELIKIGIWSVGYLEEDEEDRRMYIYSNSKELTKKELKSMGAETVRDIDDEDIMDYFSADYDKKVPIDVMTAEQFIELVKSVDYNIEQQGLGDLHLIEDTAAPGYRLLGRLGTFKNK